MPITLATFDASIGEIKLRYQEPYLTEGLNAAKAVVVPRGTHRGFRLATNAAALTVTFVADPVWMDHVAQYLTADSNDPLGYGHTLTIRRVGGNFTAALPASNTYVIAILASYSIGNATTAVINAYLLADYLALPAAQQSELVVLGVVVTPGAGVIPPANITHRLRVFAGNEIGQDAVPFQRLIDDPAFSQVGIVSPTVFNLVSGSTWFFNDVATGANATFIQSDAQNTGANTLNVNLPAPATVSYEFDAVGAAISVQAGQVLNAEVDLKIMASPTGGAFVLTPFYTDITGAPVSTPDPAAIPYSVTNVGAFKKFTAQFVVPQGAVFITKIAILATNLVYLAGVDVFRAKCFQAWLETLGPANAGEGAMRPARQTLPSLRMTENQQIPSADDPAFVSYKAGTKFVTLQRADGLFDSTHIPPGLVVQSTLRAGPGMLDPTGATPALNKPRLITDALTGAGGDTYTLLWTTQNVTVSQYALWARGNGTDLALVITFNAFWDQNTQLWTGAYDSYRIYVGAAGIWLQRAPEVGYATFADSAWIAITEFTGDKGGPLPQQALQYFSGLIDTAANAAIPRMRFISAGAGVSLPKRTLLFDAGRFPPVGFLRGMRVYAYQPDLSGFPGPPVSDRICLEVVQNAYWDPSGPHWVQDGVPGTCSKMTFGDMALGLFSDTTFSTYALGAGTFVDSAWVTWSIGLSGVSRGHCNITVDKGNVAHPLQAAGYNIASAAFHASTVGATPHTVVRVVLTNPVILWQVPSAEPGQSGGYPVSVNFVQNNGRAGPVGTIGIYAENFTLNSFDLVFFNTSASTYMDPSNDFDSGVQSDLQVFLNVMGPNL